MNFSSVQLGKGSDPTRGNLEHEENQGQEAGGQGSAGHEDKKKAGAASGLSKDNTVNRHAQRLPCHKETVNHTR